jgi:hypothetical protein
VILGLKVEAGLLPGNACGSPPLPKLKVEDEFDYDYDYGNEDMTLDTHKAWVSVLGGIGTSRIVLVVVLDKCV